MGQKSEGREVRRGTAVVKIYRATFNGYPAHELSYYLAGKRKHKVLYGKTDEEAQAEAGKIAETINAGNGVVLDLTAEDAHAYRHAMKLIEPTARPLVAVVSEHIEALKALGQLGVSLGEVIRYYADRHAVTPRTVPEVVAGFLNDREQDGVGERHAADLRNRLERWAADFPGRITQLTGAQIDRWLREQQVKRNWEGLTRNHHRAAILNLTNYAKAQNYLPATWNEMARVAKANEDPSAVEIFTPAHARTLLETAAARKPELLPFLAIGLFAGVRHAEIERMDWADLYWEHAQVFVGRGKVNALQRRVPMQENLRAWLWPIRKPAGPVCELPNIGHALIELADLAGLEWVHNGARHSYISHRLEMTKDVARVAEEAGNSPRVIKTRYARPVPTKDAEAFFAISPDNTVIVPMPVAV
jgi:integrase